MTPTRPACRRRLLDLVNALLPVGEYSRLERRVAFALVGVRGGDGVDVDEGHPHQTAFSEEVCVFAVGRMCKGLCVESDRDTTEEPPSIVAGRSKGAFLRGINT